MQQARIDKYLKDSSTGDIVLHAYLTDELGKPIEGEITVRLSQDALQKLIREELPTEENRIQELLDKIHKIRTERLLNIENIDKRIEELNTSAGTAFDNCVDKVDVLRMMAKFRTQISLITQKRHISKFGVQEESELGLQLAKLRAKGKEQ